MHTRSEKLRHFFQTLSKDTLAQVMDIYDQNVTFRDPVHELHGAKAIQDYYKGLYQNVDSISFDFQGEVIQEDQHVLIWNMQLTTPKLNSGKPYSVPGNSWIRFNAQDQIVYHQDFFDMGDFVYERIPLLGGLVRMVKKRMQD
jgi:hypothetical protein